MAAKIDHVHIRSTDVGGTARFLHDLLDLTPVQAPGTKDMGEGCWMQDRDGHAVIHIGPVASHYPSDHDFPFAASRGGGAIHHIALACDDLGGIRQRIRDASLHHVENHILEIGLTQIFLEEHNGILLELNFRS